MRHTIEEKMMALKGRKQALFDEILGATSGNRPHGSLINKDDFEFLLGTSS